MKTHGVYISERETNLQTPEQGTSALQVVFGTAPIHLLANPSQAVNEPIIAYTFAEAQAQLGYSSNYGAYTLCQSMDATFSVVNVAPIIFVNVLDPAKHSTEVAGTSVAVNGKTVTIQQEGILLSSVSIKAGEDTLSAGTDYILSFNSDGHVVVTFVAAQQSVTVAYTKLDPSKVTKADIIGGYDSTTGAETGLELIRRIYPKFTLTPGLIVAPGWSHIPEVAAVMQAKCEEINGAFQCECVLDLDTTQAKLYTDCKAVKESSGFTSSHAAVLWPKVMALGRVFYYSAIFAAETAYVDTQNGDIPDRSPSNKLIGITGTVLEDGTEVALDRNQANVLNGEGIITAINSNGWRTWGNNSACYPSSTDPKDCWFCTRRFFSWYGNSFILTYDDRVDDPSNYRLIESVVDSENIRANSLVPDHCAGLEIEYNPDDNPVSEILDGKMHFGIKLAPYVPGETIIADLAFDPDLLAAALSGGE